MVTKKQNLALFSRYKVPLNGFNSTCIKKKFYFIYYDAISNYLIQFVFLLSLNILGMWPN